MPNVNRTRQVSVDPDTLEIAVLGVSYADVEYLAGSPDNSGVENGSADALVRLADAVYMFWSVYDASVYPSGLPAPGHYWTRFTASPGADATGNATPVGHGETDTGYLRGWLVDGAGASTTIAKLTETLCVVTGMASDMFRSGGGHGGARFVLYLVEVAEDGTLSVVDVAPIDNSDVPFAIVTVGSKVLVWGEHRSFGALGREQLGSYAAAQWVTVDTSSKRFNTENVPTVGPLAMQFDGWVGEKIYTIGGRGWIPSALVLVPDAGWVSAHAVAAEYEWVDVT